MVPAGNCVESPASTSLFLMCVAVS
jgi:hypothetical protein